VATPQGAGSKTLSNSLVDFRKSIYQKLADRFGAFLSSPTLGRPS